MATIKIPKNTEELIELSEKIIVKHKQDEENCPLRDVDLKSLERTISILKEQYKESLELKKRSDELREHTQLILGVHQSQKNIKPETVRFKIVQIRDVLKGIHRESIHKIAMWGYEILEKE